MAELKTVAIYTGNRGFRQYIDNRKPKIKTAPGFKEELADAMRKAGK